MKESNMIAPYQYIRVGCAISIHLGWVLKFLEIDAYERTYNCADHITMLIFPTLIMIIKMINIYDKFLQISSRYRQIAHR